MRLKMIGAVAMTGVAAVSLAMLGASVVGVGTAGASGGGGAGTALVTASGSSWAANAVNQWVADVASEGLQVVYTPDGDAQGRQDFANRTSDFSVTSIGYQGFDSSTGIDDTSQGRPYAYLPIAAGGTSFPYQIKVDGQQVRNLRLSGETLTKIFTNEITNWDDPEITADNNHHALPDLPIIPVVQSEGSGATYQLTRYFATQYPSIWDSYAGSSQPTEYFPTQGDQIAQNGSNSAMNYVSSSVANGAIGYVEYSYPLAQNYPVAAMENSAGYFELPTQYNVAVALEKAQINMDKSSPDYLLQNLNDVYTDTDPRTYPLSSYVYMIEPTGTYPSPESEVTPAMRQTIADFSYYAICQGQREIGPIGYSPLPVNLVEAAFGQLEQLKAASPTISLAGLNIATCDNPTFIPGDPNTNYLAKIAPEPPSCDKVGAGPCSADQLSSGNGNPPSGGGGSGSGGGTGSGSGGGGSGGGSGGGGGKSGGGGNGSGGGGGKGGGGTGSGGGGSGGGGTGSGGGGTGSGSGGGGSGGGSGGGGNGSGGGGTGGGGTGSGGGGGGAGAGGGTTGDTGGSSSTTPGGAGVSVGSTGGDIPQVVPAELNGYSSDSLTGELAPLAGVILLLVFVLPGIIGYRLTRRRRDVDGLP